MSQNIINKLYEENFNRELRKKLEKVKGQLIFVNDLKGFEKALRATLGKPKARISPEKSQKIIDVAIAKGRKLQNAFYKYNPDRFNLLVEKIYTSNLLHQGEVLGRDAFLVSSFNRSIGIMKKAMINELKSQRKDLTEAKVSELKQLIHRGHGERGEAVSQVQIAFGYQALIDAGLSDNDIANHLNNALLNPALAIEVDEAEFIKDLFINYNQIVDEKGNLRADYVSRITFQFSKENTGVDSVLEKKVLNTFYKKVVPYFEKEILDLKGSSSLKQKVAASIIEELTKVKGAKSKILPQFDPKRVKKRTKGKVKQEISAKKSPTKVRNTTLPAKKPKARVKSSNINLHNLVPILNKSINEVVAKNMGLPGLQYQTGRFANSVRVENVAVTPQGFPSIGYTYDRYPYEVFEYPKGRPGWATSERDPRKLISKSIREIATGLIGTRFYTRRI